MADPIAVITITGTSEINYSDLSPTPPLRTLSGTSSTPGSGSSISTYQWYLLSAPTGSAATFNDDTLASPTLGPLDRAGTYRVFLVVTNDLSDSSHSAPVPIQSLSSPYSFAVPPASAFFEIRVLTEFAGLKKVAYGERDWLEDGLWPLVDAVDAHEGKLDDIWVSPGVIKANTIQEYTSANGVYVDGVLLKDGDVKAATSSDALYTNILIGGSAAGGSSSLIVYASPTTVIGNFGCSGLTAMNTINEYTTNSGVTVEGVLVKDGDVTVATSSDRVYTNRVEAGSVAGGSNDLMLYATGDTLVRSNSLDCNCEVRSTYLEPYSNNTSVIARGRGTHTADLDVDIIEADTTGGGVTVLGKGTHSYDLQADIIKTNSVTSDVVGAMTLTNTVGAIQIQAATAITLTAGSAIQMAGLETNLGGSANYNSVPVCIASQYSNTTTTGTSEQTLWGPINLPANMLHVNGDKIVGWALFATAANNHSKTVTVTINSTPVTIATRTSAANNGWIKLDFVLQRTGSSTQVYWSESRDSDGVYGAGSLSTSSVTDTAAIPFAIKATTASGAGDVTLKTVHIEFWHSDTLP
jgi:hypothetical protein